MGQQGFGKLISIKEVYELMTKLVKEIDDEKIDIESANSRVLSNDIIAPINVPNFDKSAMDGFAVHSADLVGASNTHPKMLTMIDSVAAGYPPDKVMKKGACIEIATGAPLPTGADAVIMLEYTEHEGDIITVYKPVAEGENIIRIGSDIQRGEVVIKNRSMLTPRGTGAIAALGITHIRVKKKIKVAVLSTGDELITSDEELIVGRIFNINSRTFIDTLKSMNCDVIDMGIVKDEKQTIMDKLKEAVKSADLVLVSGGSSLGTSDLLVEIIKEMGELHVHGIAVKPGKPTIIGEAEDTLIFGMPGHPTSALSNFYMLIVPVLNQMTGVHIERDFTECILSRKIASTVGRYEFIPVWLENTGDKKIAHPVLKGSSAITSLTEANGFIEIDENTEVVPKNTVVKVKFFD